MLLLFVKFWRIQRNKNYCGNEKYYFFRPLEGYQDFEKIKKSMYILKFMLQPKDRMIIFIHQFFIMIISPRYGWTTPVLILHSGMENVPLKKMWLQSCCLAARATETRDQGETCLLKQRCGLVMDFVSTAIMWQSCVLLQIWWLLQHVVTPPALCLLGRRSLWVILRFTCRDQHVPLLHDL